MATIRTFVTDRLVRGQEQYVDALHQVRDIHLATMDVQRAAAAVLVPLTVAALPNREWVLPALDRTLDGAYDVASSVVRRQYDLAERAAEVGSRALGNGSR